MSKAKEAILKLIKVYDSDLGEIEDVALQLRITQHSEVGDDERVYTVSEETRVGCKAKTRSFIDRSKNASVYDVVLKAIAAITGKAGR